MNQKDSARFRTMALLALLGLATSRGSSSAVTVYLTTIDQKSTFQQQPNLALAPTATINNTFFVNATNPFQQMIGFGAAMTDSAAFNLFHAESNISSALMNKLFAGYEAGGIGMSLLRLPLGVSDFSVNYSKGSITYDDSDEDWDLSHFSTAHDDEYIIPMLKLARQINPQLQIVASPWTAPLWMKDSGKIGSGSLKNDDRTYSTYASYLIKVLQEYETKGVHIDYLTFQNEPGHGGCGTMPCMTLTSTQEARLALEFTKQLTNIAPTPANTAVQQVKLLAYDHNWDKPEYPLALLSNGSAPYASADVWAGVAWHCYAGDVSAQSEVYVRLHAEFAARGLETHMTECSGGGWQSSWGDVLVGNQQSLLIGGANNHGQSVLHWNLALDENSGPHCKGGACCKNCRGVVTLPTTARTLGDVTLNVEFFGLAHHSSFVPRGSRRIGAAYHSSAPTPAPLPPGCAFHKMCDASCSQPGGACATVCTGTYQGGACACGTAKGCGSNCQGCPQCGNCCCYTNALREGGVFRADAGGEAAVQGTDVQVVAYRSLDSKIVLVALNPTKGKLTVSVSTGATAAAQDVPDNSFVGFSYDLPPGVATFTWDA